MQFSAYRLFPPLPKGGGKTEWLYKKPRSIDIVTNLPKNFQDKILKREFRERYWQGLEWCV
jgi:hypothetical protein